MENLNNEVWISFNASYEASNYGRVKLLSYVDRSGHKRSEKILSPAKSQNGYLRVMLFKDGKPQLRPVHRIVYEAFNGKIPDGMEINHINENKLDNRLENLEVVNRSQNINYGTRNRRAAKKMAKPVLQYSLDGKCLCYWFSLTDCHRETGFNTGLINRCCLNKHSNCTAYGYKWKYAKEGD